MCFLQLFSFVLPAALLLHMQVKFNSHLFLPQGLLTARSIAYGLCDSPSITVLGKVNTSSILLFGI